LAEGYVPEPVIHTIRAATHGRYLVEDPAAPGPGAAPLLVGFHGQAETARRHLDTLRAIAAGRRWRLVAIQALNRHYTRANEVVASWMTREDRELAIADNLAYVRSVVDEVMREPGPGPLVYVGFSQGVAMAYRAAAFAGAACDGLILLAGDLPPDVAPAASRLPPLLVGRGRDDRWYTADRAGADITALTRAGVHVEEHVFDGGHEWHASFVMRAGRFLDERRSAS
jgi:predicted esterase